MVPGLESKTDANPVLLGLGVCGRRRGGAETRRAEEPASDRREPAPDPDGGISVKWLCPAFLMVRNMGELVKNGDSCSPNPLTESVRSRGVDCLPLRLTPADAPERLYKG